MAEGFGFQTLQTLQPRQDGPAALQPRQDGPAALQCEAAWQVTFSIHAFPGTLD